jgi:patatin-related protein
VRHHPGAVHGGTDVSFVPYTRPPDQPGEGAGMTGATQEIRLAVVLNGGVSLAVWISGVTHELNQLVQASRRRGTPNARSDAYADLLDVLQADARIDVIAGTSAGGINGGFLALGLVHGCDLTGLRDLWQDQGSLSTLLRNPRDKEQPSLLRGGYFHDELAKAYEKVWPERDGGVAAAPDEDVDLFLTGTLWEGRRSFFADDMGRRITEVDHDATFHFTSDPEVVTASEQSEDRGDLHSSEVTRQLAVASRCTASFPAAFEPFPVKIDEKAAQLPDGRWPSEAGRANFRRSQYVIDGGILRNKPIRPAIDAVYRQPAAQQVRRILAYVVPDPGEAATTTGRAAVTDLPDALDVVLGVMTRLRTTNSVADELDEVERRNRETAHRRRVRDRLAATLVEVAAAPGNGRPGGDLVTSSYPGYLEVRREDTAQSVAALLLSSPRKHPWSRHELATELRDLAGKTDFPFIPHASLEAALDAEADDWRWGQSTVRRLGDLVLDVLKRAVWVAPLDDPHRDTIVEQRAWTHEVLGWVRQERVRLDAFWRGARKKLPDRSNDLAASQAEIVDLRAKLAALVATWGTAGEQAGMASRLHGKALELARCLLNAAEALRAIASGRHSPVDDGSEQQRLHSLVEYLAPPHATVAGVLRNMLRLEVVHLAFTGGTDIAEQGVELVQMSSLRADLVTGIQLHHFGAFYRKSWRANDWLRGRLDGCEQLVQMLLAPERLKQVGLTLPGAAAATLKEVAVGPEGSAWHDELAAAWDAEASALTTELEVLEGHGPLPRTFPLTAERIAHRLRVELLPEELASLAATVCEEPDPVKEAEQWATRLGTRLDGHADRGTSPTAAELGRMLESSEVVGHQSIAAEGDRGSDTFARTVTHATATLTATGASIDKPKAAVALVKALRGYALLLWVLVNLAAGGGSFARNLTSLAVGVGGALIALALLVPGVPALFPLAGLVLILAAASAAALRHRELGGRRLAARLAVVTVLGLAALAAVVYQRMLSENQGLLETLWQLAVQAIVVALVVGLGWFIGYPKGRTTGAGPTSTTGAGRDQGTPTEDSPERNAASSARIRSRSAARSASSRNGASTVDSTRASASAADHAS